MNISTTGYSLIQNSLIGPQSDILQEPRFELTAAETVPGFHRIPFSSRDVRELVGRKTSNIFCGSHYENHHIHLTMKRDDTLWKSIQEDIFDDFLRFFYPHAGTVLDLCKNFSIWTKNWGNYSRPRITHQARDLSTNL